MHGSTYLFIVTVSGMISIEIEIVIHAGRIWYLNCFSNNPVILGSWFKYEC